MKPTADDLLGYLLGALESEEHRRVDRAVSESPEVHTELLRLRERIQPLARLEEIRALEEERDNDFPAGLARRACEFVARESREGVSTATPHASELAPSELAPKEFAPTESTGAQVKSASVVGSAQSVAGPTNHVVMSPVLAELSRRGSWQVQDFLVLSAVALLAVGILAPAILASRNQARLAACQDNLRRVGMALFNYAEANHNRFVSIAKTGPLNVAGAYAPVLKDGGFVDQDRFFYCTSAVQNGLSQPTATPSLQELEQAHRHNSQKLAQLQQLMGGSYAYSLGYYDQDQYVGPLNLGRSFRVIMADAPSPALANRDSSNHDGAGLNILFEDGSVRHAASAAVGLGKESIFVNRHGLVAAGADVQDSVVGASNVSAWLSPNFYRN